MQSYPDFSVRAFKIELYGRVRSIQLRISILVIGNSTRRRRTDHKLPHMREADKNFPVRGVCLTGKYRLLAAANFEFVAVRVFEKESVVARTVLLTNLRSLKISTAGIAHEFGNAIDFFARVRPEREPRAIRTMVFVLVESEKFNGRSLPPA